MGTQVSQIFQGTIFSIYICKWTKIMTKASLQTLSIMKQPKPKLKNTIIKNSLLICLFAVSRYYEILKD